MRARSLSILRAWGRETVVFDFPHVTLRVRGLSNAQSLTFRRVYGDFLAHEASSARPTILCHAHHLRRALGPTGPDTFSLHGQYAPLQVRRADCLEVTGIDFVSSIRLGQTSTATLCTENEEELATTSVFENFLRVFSAYHVLGEGGLVLHSAGLVVDNRAYVFIGRSGAGKTTLTRKAQEYGAKVLSDDLNVVLPTPPGGDGYVGCAVPFAGEFGRILDQELERHYPLAGIVLLEQGDDLNAKPVGKASALASILAGCPFVNQDDNELDRLFDTIGRLLHGVPVCRLSSRRDDEVGAIMAAVTAALTVV